MSRGVAFDTALPLVRGVSGGGGVVLRAISKGVVDRRGLVIRMRSERSLRFEWGENALMGIFVACVLSFLFLCRYHQSDQGWQCRAKVSRC